VNNLGNWKCAIVFFVTAVFFVTGIFIVGLWIGFVIATSTTAEPIEATDCHECGDHTQDSRKDAATTRAVKTTTTGTLSHFNALDGAQRAKSTGLGLLYDSLNQEIVHVFSFLIGWFFSIIALVENVNIGLNNVTNSSFTGNVTT
jgi:hypothetical protein